MFSVPRTLAAHLQSAICNVATALEEKSCGAEGETENESVNVASRMH
jgi:hypothetical protein